MQYLFRLPAARPVLAVSLAAMLAACGQTVSQGGRGGVVTSGASYSRPASYDPPGPSGDPWGPWIRDASRRFDVPERWIREVMRQESGGRITATSRVGAMGLMQLMPGTYAQMQSRYGLGSDPFHPYDNLMAGTAYIREMYDLYGSPAFLAAYNAGPRRLEDYLWSSRGLPGETRNYVARIGPNIVAHHPTRRAPPEVYAAAEIPLNIPAGPRRADASTMIALREQRENRLAYEPTVQVAQLPAGPVVRMEPIPDGSTTSAAAERPYQVASLSSSVVRMEPIPDGATYAVPPPPAPMDAVAPAPVVMAEPIPGPVRFEAPRAPERAPAYRLAEASPIPPRLERQPDRSRSRSEPRQKEQPRIAASAPPQREQSRQVAAAPSGRGFGLFSSAHAATLTAAPLAAAARNAGWGVQVGAFASHNLAQSAADQARNSVATMGSRVVVQPVSQGKSTLFRARVTGLSKDLAEDVCERVRHRGNCFVISPASQS